LGGGLTTPHRKKINTKRNVTKGLGIGRILLKGKDYIGLTGRSVAVNDEQDGCVKVTVVAYFNVLSQHLPQ
jgi:hypothetical protein